MPTTLSQFSPLAALVCTTARATYLVSMTPVPSPWNFPPNQEQSDLSKSQSWKHLTLKDASSIGQFKTPHATLGPSKSFPGHCSIFFSTFSLYIYTWNLHWAINCVSSMFAITVHSVWNVCPPTSLHPAGIDSFTSVIQNLVQENEPWADSTPWSLFSCR